jgi:hypothetical protein
MLDIRLEPQTSQGIRGDEGEVLGEVDFSNRYYIDNNSALRQCGGGEGGIRTHGTVTRTTVFETVPIDHSGTSPADWNL